MKSIEELENSLFICISFDNFWVWLFSGTNGGITLIGSLFSMVGGGLVGLAYYITQIFLLRESFLDRGPPQWPLLIVGLLMGIIGSTVDSLLGATFQYSGDFLLRYYFTVKFTQNKRNIFSGFVSARYALKSTANIFGVIFLEIKDFLWSCFGFI